MTGQILAVVSFATGWIGYLMVRQWLARPARTRAYIAAEHMAWRAARNDKLRADPRPPYAPHGTAAAIRRHERNKQPLCEPCRLERNRLAREYYATRKART